MSGRSLAAFDGLFRGGMHQACSQERRESSDGHGFPREGEAGECGDEPETDGDSDGGASVEDELTGVSAGDGSPEKDPARPCDGESVKTGDDR